MGVWWGVSYLSQIVYFLTSVVRVTDSGSLVTPWTWTSLTFPVFSGTESPVPYLFLVNGSKTVSWSDECWNTKEEFKFSLQKSYDLSVLLEIFKDHGPLVEVSKTVLKPHFPPFGSIHLVGLTTLKIFGGAY